LPISFELAKEAPANAELVVEGIAQGSVPDDSVLQANGFEAKPGQTAMLPDRLLVGLGPVGDDGPSDDVLRSAAASAARAATRCRVIAATLPPTQAFAVGFALGSKSFAK
jgi:hypothetical protein